jgi:hypothetical protein
MARPEDEAVGPESHRMAYWGAVIGGGVTIIGGVFLALFGLLFVGSYIHDPLDILIPLSAAVLSGSAISMIGGFDAIAPKNYRRALVGSAMPAAFFLGGYVMAYIGGGGGWIVLLPLGIMGASGVLLVAVSRGAFFDGSPNDYGGHEEEWRKRLVKSAWGVLGVVAILLITVMVVAKLVPDSLSEAMCFLVPVLIGLLFFLSYILWLKFLYWRERRK